MSIANIRAIHKVVTANAMAKKRFADRFAFLVNHKSSINVKPINSIPKKAAS